MDEERQEEREISCYMRERDDRKAEWGSLLIEQQKCGEKAKRGKRDVTQLRKYSPPAAETVVIS
ncbi:cell division protein FtsL, partial [Acinetobacter baumannii]|nr:cell division protein FtsL [Acinetobacter baumannii]